MASCYPPAGEQHEQSEQLLGQQGQQQEQEQELYMSWMLWYIQHGDLPGMRRLLDSHGFCDFTSPQGLQPAHLAARYQLPEILDLLVRSGANVNEYSSSSSSVLQLAMQCYPTNAELCLRMVQCLLCPDTKQSDCVKNEQILPSCSSSHITDPDILGEALQVAAGEGWERLVPILLAAGADPNYCSPGDEFFMTPLVGMIFENQALPGHCTVLRMLLAAGADLTHISNEWTAVEYALRYDRQDLLPLLGDSSEFIQSHVNSDSQH